jgi:hypothetical protein
VSRPFRLELLGGQHDRASFSCGIPALDRYFHAQVSQDMRRRVASCFVAVANADDRIAGFYTIAAAGIPITELPQDVVRRLPRYPTLPAIRLGRLAVDLAFRG